MKYYIRCGGRISGPSTIEEIAEQIASASLLPEAEVVEALGQSSFDLASSKWRAIGEIAPQAPAIAANRAAFTPTASLSTHYRACRECREFLVNPNDEYCPYCGIIAPFPGTEERIQSELRVRQLRKKLHGSAVIPWLVGGAACIAVLLDMLFGAEMGAVALGGNVLAGLAVAAYVHFSVSVPQRARTYLRATEQMVEKRLAELQARQAEVAGSRARVAAESDAPRWAKARDLLDKAYATLARQCEGYLEQRWEIRLIRRQNELEPLAHNLNPTTYDEIEKCVSACSDLHAKGCKMLDEAETALPGQRAFLNRAREVLANAEGLRQEFIAQEALIAVRGVAPLDHVLDAQPVPIGRPDLFSGRVRAMNEIASSFDSLEAEYQRLATEDEYAQSILRQNR